MNECNKFLAADPAGRNVAPVAHNGRNSLQRSITDFMAMIVIDLLEMIKVEQGKTARAKRSRRFVECRYNGAAIIESGQVIRA